LAKQSAYLSGSIYLYLNTVVRDNEGWNDHCGTIDVANVWSSDSGITGKRNILRQDRDGNDGLREIRQWEEYTLQCAEPTTWKAARKLIPTTLVLISMFPVSLMSKTEAKVYG
jgi:hypothetical protein